MPLTFCSKQRTIYAPLSKDFREVRVLVILPSRDPSSMVKCRLVHANLDRDDFGPSAPFEFYEALSYTWGDPTGKVQIRVDRQPFEVTRNLDAVLRRLRDDTTCGYLWVDAICINQIDIAERSAQVAMMKTIYEKAEQTLVWLGEEADDSGVAMDLIDKITDLDTPEEWAQESMETSGDLPQWQAVARLLSRSYWRRVWVRQEIAVARDVVVMCGDRMIKWKHLTLAADFLIERNGDKFTSISAGVSEYNPGSLQIVTMGVMRERIQAVGIAPFDFLLLQSRQLECTDNRDRVFSILGMADPNLGIQPDYTLMRNKVFEMATVAAIKTSKKLDIIRGCQDPYRTNGLPSWVPDFDTDWRELDICKQEDSEALFDAADGSVTKVTDTTTTSAGESCLILSGVIVDEISTVGRTMDTLAIDVSVLENWWDIAKAALENKALDISQAEIRNKYWRTLVTDLEPTGERAADDFINQAVDHKSDPNPAHVVEGTLYSQSLRDVCACRRLFTTRSGRIALGSEHVEVGDTVCVLAGGNVPYVLRSEGSSYLLIGHSYVDGIMSGEAFVDVTRGVTCMVDFILK